MVNANAISVDATTLVKVVIKAIHNGKGMKYVAEQTGLKTATISQRLRVIKDTYPQLKDSLSFPKGKRGGKSVTKIDKDQLTELEAMIAATAGNLDPSVVRENGMALVNNANMTTDQQDSVKSLQSQVDINAPSGVGIEQLQVA